MRRRLVRCIPQLAFGRRKPSRFLYTSGRANRCNPAGVGCLYFSETETIAAAEFSLAWRGTPGEHQPKLVVYARVHLRKVLDLENPEVMQFLGLSAEDPDIPWRLAREPTPLQRVGEAIAGQQGVAALRYPSAAARKQHRRGWNVAIYPDALMAPDRVEILGDTDKPLEVIP